MAEHDVFEARLRAALVRHVADGPTDFDALGFARQVAAQEPRRRGLAAALTGLGVAFPRYAWVLVVALLTALLGGMLVVGSQQDRKLPAVVPPVGQVFECPPGSNPDEPGPVDQARPAGGRSATAFDRQAGRLVVVTNGGKGVETWTFDVCANTWTQMRPNREPPWFDWAWLVYDVDSDATILFSPFGFEAPSTGWGVWAYDLQANTWTEKQAPPTGPTGEAVVVYSPSYDLVTGLVVAADYTDRSLWNYDVESDTWTPIQQANAGPPREVAVIAYDASVDRLVVYGDGAYGAPPYETWLFDIRTGTWSRSAAERPTVGDWLTAPGLVYDEAAERTVVFRRSPLTAYDASADRWEILAGPETLWEDAPGVEVYDAVNRRLVGWGGNSAQDSAVVAFDLMTREWTVLLEPGYWEPANTPAATPAPTSARTATPPGPTSPMPTVSPASTSEATPPH